MFKSMTRAGLILTMALSLTACAETVAKFESAYTTFTSASVSPKAVVVAASAYDVAEITATNYTRLRRCTGTNGPVCRDPALRTKIDGAIYAGRVARNNLKAFLRAHPGQLGPQGDYDALVAATSTLNQATAVYRAANP